MELDEFKSQIKNKLSTDHAGRSDADIAVLLTKRTNSITDKLKKSLRLEILLCIIAVVIFACISVITTVPSFRTYFTVFSVLGLVFLVIIIYLLRRIQTLSCDPLPVKSNLQTIVAIIDEFTRRYFQFTMGLVPVCFVFALLMGYNERQAYDASTHHTGTHILGALWQVFLLAGMYMLALAIAAYYFTKWYLKKLYGKYVDQLKACIEELGE